MNQLTIGKYTPYLLWVLFFGYAVCMALIFQNVVVPNMLSIQGQGKLLAHDAVLFDQVAWSLAQEIREYGWGRWRLFIDYSSPGNVSILAALYAIWGHDPSLAVPINAMLHAFSGTLLFLICCELAEYKKVGVVSGVVAGSLFVVFPSSLTWYGQLHKDTYAIAGTLLLLLIWLRIVSNPLLQIRLSKTVLYTIIAVSLIGIVRPYGLTLQLIVGLGMVALLLVFYTKKVSFNELGTRLLNAFVVVAILIFGVVVTKQHSGKVNINPEKMVTFTHQVKEANIETWQWQNSQLIPAKVEEYIAKAARTRAHIIEHDYRLGAKSTMDADQIPSNIIEVLTYIPRGLQIATFAPFPNTWFMEKSAIKYLASAEMLVYYLFLPGVLLLFWFNRTKSVIATLFFTLSFLTILGFTLANLGTLYRMRYAYTLTLIALGALGWAYWLDKQGIFNKTANFFKSKNGVHINDVISEKKIGMEKKRTNAVGAGIAVALLTLVVSVGFFYRDLLMAHSFGFSAELDIFFMALLIPMTLVTILCMPLGTAFSPIFIEYVEHKTKVESQVLISNIVGIISVVLFAISLGLVLILPLLIPFFMPDTSSGERQFLYQMIVIALPILLFSGSLIIGNTVLNALGQAKQASVAQVIVPITAVLSLWLYGDDYGVVAVILGMFVGQLLNLTIVQYFLTSQGYSVVPALNNIRQMPIASLSTRYVALVASALLAGTIVLVNTSLALKLGEGAVSIFSFGNKIVLLILGLLSAAIAGVMLPYFSALIAQNNLISARKELSVFLMGLTFFIVPICSALFYWSETMITFIFNHGEFNREDLDTVTRVMQYALVQVPFVTCNLLLIKFSIATHHVLTIFIVACVGLIANLLSTLVLMNVMGVPGIALGASIAVIVSTTLLLFILFRYGHIAFTDLSVLLLSWLLFLTLLININFNSAPGIIILASAFIVLSLGALRTFMQTNSVAQTSN